VTTGTSVTSAEGKVTLPEIVETVMEVEVVVEEAEMEAEMAVEMAVEMAEETAEIAEIEDVVRHEEDAIAEVAVQEGARAEAGAQRNLTRTVQRKAAGVLAQKPVPAVEAEARVQ